MEKQALWNFATCPESFPLGLTAVNHIGPPALRAVPHLVGVWGPQEYLPFSLLAWLGVQGPSSASPWEQAQPCWAQALFPYPEWQLPEASSLFQWKVSLAGSGPGPVQVPFASQLLAPPWAVTWLDASYLGPGGALPA